MVFGEVHQSVLIPEAVNAKTSWTHWERAVRKSWQPWTLRIRVKAESHSFGEFIYMELYSERKEKAEEKKLDIKQTHELI